MKQGLYKCIKTEDHSYIFCVVPKNMDILINIKTGDIVNPYSIKIICEINFEDYFE